MAPQAEGFRPVVFYYRLKIKVKPPEVIRY